MTNAWPEIEWDDHGYPTDASLAAVAELPLDFHGAPQFVRRELAMCAEVCCASYDESKTVNRFGDTVIEAHFSTGGWSGAESLMGAIEGRIDTGYSMQQWNRGGHYIFEFPQETPAHD